MPFAATTVMEIGCGPGHYAKAIAPQTTAYFALDVSEDILAAAKQRCVGIANLTFLHADAQAIPLPASAAISATRACRAPAPPVRSAATMRCVGPSLKRLLAPPSCSS